MTVMTVERVPKKKGFSTGRGSKTGRNKKFFSALPKTGPKQTNERVTELFCDKNPKTFQVFAGAESS